MKIEDMKKLNEDLTKNLLHHIKIRFPPQEKFHLFSIFDPEEIKRSNDSYFGDEILDKLCKSYKKDFLDIKAEWNNYKQFIKHSNQTSEEILAICIQSDSLRI